MNVKVGIRIILFGIFALNWIMKPISVNPSSYIVAHHMFDKNIKVQKEFYFWFDEIFCLIELRIARVAKCFISPLGNDILTFYFITCTIWYTCQSHNTYGFFHS